MMISFDRKCREKAMNTGNMSSRDAFQILDEIEGEMNRLYQEVRANHIKKEKGHGKRLLRKRSNKISMQNEIGSEVNEMELISKTIDQIGKSLVRGKQTFS